MRNFSFGQLIIFSCLICFSSLAARGARAAVSVPQMLSLNGELFTGAGTPILSSSVNFQVQIYDALGTCVLYSESHLAEDLSRTQGRFSLTLGNGSATVNNVDGSGAFSPAVFANSGTVPVANCSQTTVALNPGDVRQIRISYDIGAGLVALTPDVPLVSSIYAMIADSLQGKSATDFIQVVNDGTSALNQTNAGYAFSGANWPRLRDLIDGTSSQYLPTAPGTPVNLNSNRAINVADPTGAQDAATKHYADVNVAGSPVDVSAVGPMTGNNSVLHWDATANKWVAGAANFSPSGTAGGALSGTYPNPTLANDVVTAAKIKSTGGGPNRILITDNLTGANLTYGFCNVNQVYAWSASGWVCADVNSIALQSRSVSSVSPGPGQVLGWNGVSSVWEPTSASLGTVTRVQAGTALLGGTILSTGTLSIDVGAAANQIPQENANGQITQGAGSLAFPSYSFGGALDTGIYSPGAHQLALASSGTTALVVDTTGFIGVGAAAPLGPLHIASNYGRESFIEYAGATAAGPAFIGRRSRGTMAAPLANVAGDEILGIGGRLWPNLTGPTSVNLSYKSSEIHSSTARGTEIHLQTTPNGTSTKSTRLFVGNDGSIGMSTTTPAAALDVVATGTNSAIIVPRDTTANRPPTAVNGMLRYNTSANAMEGYINGAWATLSAGASAGTVTSVAAGNGLLGGPVTTTGALSVDVGTGASKIPQLGAASQLLLSNGTSSAPAYAFANDSTSGLFSPGSGSLSLATTGTARMNFMPSGYVAIGTTTASEMLTVAGNILSLSDISGAGTIRVGGGGVFANMSDWFASYGFSNAAGNNTADLTMKTSNLPRVTVTKNGLVGIGSSAPQAALDVVGAGSTSALIVPRDSTTNRPNVSVNGMLRYNTSLNAMEVYANNSWSTLSAGSSAGTITNLTAGLGLLGGAITTSGTISVDAGSAAGKIVRETADAQIAQTLGTAALPSYSFAGNTNTGLFSPAANTLALSSNGTAALTVINGGNVGVGTSLPAARLSVVESVPSNTQLEIRNPNPSGGAYATLGAYTQDYFNEWRTYQSGSSQIQTNAPFLDIKNQVGYISFETGGVEHMRLATNGNVGIGVTAPQAGLDIATTGTMASALIVPRDSTANRPATAVNGMIRYNTDLTALESYTNGAWNSILSGIPANVALDGGNNLSAGMTLGTNTNQSLTLKTNNSVGWVLDTNQNMTSTTGATGPQFIMQNPFNRSIESLETYTSSTTSSMLLMKKGRGYSYTTPSVINSNDTLGTLAFKGYGGSTTDWTNLSLYDVGLEVRSTEAFTTTAHGSKLVFYTTYPGTAAKRFAAVLTDTGLLGVNNAAPGAVVTANNDAVTNQGMALAGNTNVANKTNTGMYASTYATNSANLNLTMAGALIQNYDSIATGYTSDHEHGAWVQSLRNGLGNPDGGTVTNLYGLEVWSGHTNVLASPLPTTTNVIGIGISPFHASGNITNSYAMKINPPNSGATVTNQWGIYEENSAPNYFNGSIGIGTNAPTAKLEVAGQIVSKETVNATGATADFSNGNSIVLQSVGGTTITLSNMVAGGVYNLVVEDTNSRTYTINGCGTIYWSPANGATTNRSIFTIYRRGATACYITWSTGFN